MYFPPSESTFATTDAKDGRPSDPLRRTVSQAQPGYSPQYSRSGVDSIATHDHGGVLRIGQESYRSRIGDGVNTAQLNVDLEAHVRKVLGLRLLALMALQALSRYSGLKGYSSQVEKARVKVIPYMNVTEADGRDEP